MKGIEMETSAADASPTRQSSAARQSTIDHYVDKMARYVAECPLLAVP